jgi:hypothetical protein
MTPRRPSPGPLRLEIGSRIPIPCRNCGGELMPFIVTLGTSRLYCGACKRATHVDVTAERGGLRITTRGAG